MGQAACGVEYKKEGAHHHRPAQQFAAAAHLVVHIKRHGLVLGFFQRMPAPQAFHHRMRTLHVARVTQQAVSHDRGDVLQRRRGRQLPLWRELLLRVANTCLRALFDTGDVVAQVFQALAVFQMFAAVMAFLADKAANLLLQHRVFDLITKVAHRVDKKALAIGKQHRHGVKQMGFERIAAVPMAW